MTNLCHLDQERAAAAYQLRFVTTATQMFVHIKTDNETEDAQNQLEQIWGCAVAYLAIKATYKAARGCEAKQLITKEISC